MSLVQNVLIAAVSFNLNRHDVEYLPQL